MTRPSSRFAAALVALLALLLVGASPVAAHTDFAASSPSDGEAVDWPVTEIEITFTGEASPTGEGFVILDSSGTVRAPDEVSSTDSLTWELAFDEPLAAGEVGVRWTVVAPDAHPIAGSFRFSVNPEPTPVPASTPVAASTPDAPASSIAPELDDAPGAGADSADDGVEAAARVEPTAEAQGEIPPAPTDLDEFLDVAPSAPTAVAALNTIARVVRIIGAIAVIGGVIFASFVLRGSRRDIRTVVFWIRRGALAVAIAAILASLAHITTATGSWGWWSEPGEVVDALWSTSGLAIALRVVGGLLALSQAANTSVALTGPTPVEVDAPALVAAGVQASSPTAAPSTADLPLAADGRLRWDTAASRGAVIGAVLITASFMFDGHTASEGPLWLHAVVNVVHVTAAATWVMGVAVLARLHSHRRETDAVSLELGLRFSVVATWALGAVAVAGAGLSAIVLDSVSQLWSTRWGALLLAKVALVAAAGVAGAYNHWVALPALERQPSHPDVAARFRTILTVEALLLVAVATVTAFLIGASTS